MTRKKILLITAALFFLAAAAAIGFWLHSILVVDNGYHVHVDASDQSDLLILGDSLVVLLSEDVPGPSYSATCGGHYLHRREWVSGKWLYWNLEVSSPRYLREQKQLIRRILTRQGRCTVVLEGSFNDVDAVDHWETELLESMKALKAELEAVSEGGLHPVVYMTSIIPDRGDDDWVTHFNAMLEADQGDYYIDLGLTDTWAPYYLEDDCHLNAEGSALTLRMIREAIE